MKTQKKPASGNERLAEIYRTAAQIILRKGYDATSVNDIANALGITKAGLYHYINGKKELLFDIMNFGLDELDREVTTPARGIADPEKRLRALITLHACLVTQANGAVTILVDEMAALTPEQQRKITKRKRLYFDFVRETIKQIKADGKLRNIDPTVAAFSILGMILWLSRWFRKDGSLTERQAAEEITKIVFKGLLRPETNSRNLKAV
jgi:AcrR family transcriptional regulator